MTKMVLLIIWELITQPLNLANMVVINVDVLRLDWKEIHTFATAFEFVDASLVFVYNRLGTIVQLLWAF